MNTVHTAVLTFPLWAQGAIAFLVLLGAAIAVVGSLGLWRLPSYFERVHAPAVIATLGLWCVTLASMIFFSVLGPHFAWHPLLIALFVAITVPITHIFLMRAALFRARRARHPVPPSLSHLPFNDAPATRQD